MNGLNNFSKEVYQGNKLKGFDVSKENIGQSLMLVVSELSEALEADRKERYANIKSFDSDCNFQCDTTTAEARFILSFQENIKDTFEDEIADSIIRLLDLCGGLQIDIEKHIELKLKYNSTRKFKHGKRY